MKENLERLFKESLDTYEMPYENGAWEQMSKRLDGSPATPFYRKWWFAASIGTVLVSSAVYFGLSDGKTAADPVKETPVAAQTEQTTPENTVQQRVTASVNSSETTAGSEPQHIVSHIERNYPDPVVYNSPSRSIDIQPNVIEPVVAPASPDKYLALALPKTACMNTPVSFTNPNEKANVIVVMPNGSRHTVKPKEKFSFASSKPGNVQVISGDHTDNITIEESTADLYIDVDPILVYDEKSVPVLIFKSSGAENGVIWSSNAAANHVSGNDFIVNPFVEKKVTVTAQTTDRNGCTVKKETTVRLDDQYNLLASTGFNPLSNDPRNNRFMPFALLQRDTPFELTIMDPRTQTVIFRSSDASMGWDGTGSNGMLVPINSTWLWRVVMKNPMPGEPQEYKGLITYQDR